MDLTSLNPFSPPSKVAEVKIPNEIKSISKPSGKYHKLSLLS